MPSLAAWLKSRLVRHNTFETHLPRPDTTVEVVLCRRQHATTKVKVSTPPRKKSCYRLPARGVAFVNPSPATEELRPRRRAGNDQRGGERCSFLIGFILLVVEPHQPLTQNRMLLLNTGGEVTLYPPPATEELRPRHRAGYYQRGGGSEVRFLTGVFVWLIFM